MFPASCPLAIMSDLQIAYDWSLISCPYSRSRASGLRSSSRSSATDSIPPVPAVVMRCFWACLTRSVGDPAYGVAVATGTARIAEAQTGLKRRFS